MSTIAMFGAIPDLRIESNAESVPPLVPDVDYISNSNTSSPWNTSPDDSATSDEQDSITSKFTQQKSKERSYDPESTMNFIGQSSADNAVPPETEDETQLVQYPAEHLQLLLKDQEEKRKKLKRKAELARLSRRKKKQRMGDLEAQVEELKKKLGRLEAENTSLRSSAKSQEIIKEEAGASLEDLLDSLPKKPCAMSDHVSKLIQSFNHRSHKAKATLNILKETLKPSLPLQFLEWVLNQRDAFYEDQDGLFVSLFKDELKATPAQIKKILAMRPSAKAKEDDQSSVSSGKATGDTLPQLWKRLEMDPVWDQGERFDRFCAFLQPSQVISYIEWVKRFGQVCIKIKV